MVNIMNVLLIMVFLDFCFFGKDFCVLILFDLEFDKVVECFIINFVIGVINVVLLLFGVVVNFFIILVISRKIFFWIFLNVLLGCLVVFDFFVGLFV